MIDLIQKIQPAKKAQMQWQALSIIERWEILKNAFSEPSLEFFSKVWSEEMGFDFDQAQFHGSDFLARYKERIEMQLLVTHSDQVFHAKGLVGIVITCPEFQRHGLISVLESILAGNFVFLYSPFSTSKLWLQQLFTLVPELNSFIAFIDSQESAFAFLTEHPAIKAQQIWIRHEDASVWKKALQSKASAQVLSPGKNSAVILPGFDSEILLRELWPALFLAGGVFPESISRLYVVESALQELLLFLQEHWPQESAFDLGKGHSRAEEVISQMRAEKGKLILGGRTWEESGRSFISPTLVQDLPNCSELMQEPLYMPLVTLTSVKYPFDAARWVNNSDYAWTCSLFGPEEKCKKIQMKFEVGNVGINSWSFHIPMDHEPLKECRTSFATPGVFGTLWNHVTKLT